MTISLEPETERTILEKLKGDRYSTVDKVVREALQLLEERDRLLDQHQPIKSIEEFDGMVKQLLLEYSQHLRDRF